MQLVKLSIQLYTWYTTTVYTTLRYRPTLLPNYMWTFICLLFSSVIWGLRDFNSLFNVRCSSVYLDCLVSVIYACLSGTSGCLPAWPPSGGRESVATQVSLRLRFWFLSSLCLLSLEDRVVSEIDNTTSPSQVPGIIQYAWDSAWENFELRN